MGYAPVRRSGLLNGHLVAKQRSSIGMTDLFNIVLSRASGILGSRLTLPIPPFHIWTKQGRQSDFHNSEIKSEDAHLVPNSRH
jgi:hypothetical protein